MTGTAVTGPSTWTVTAMEIKCSRCNQAFHEDEYDDHVCSPEQPPTQRERRDKFNPSSDPR